MKRHASDQRTRLALGNTSFNMKEAVKRHLQAACNPKRPLEATSQLLSELASNAARETHNGQGFGMAQTSSCFLDND